MVLLEGDHEQPRSLKHIDRKKLREATQEVNVLAYIQTTDVTETNRLVRAGAIFVVRMLGVKKRANATNKEPIWKRRIKSQIDLLRRDISKLQRGKTERAKDCLRSRSIV